MSQTPLASTYLSGEQLANQGRAEQKLISLIESIPVEAVPANSDKSNDLEATQQLSEDLFSIADILREQASLLRALTNPSRSSVDREALMTGLLDGKCDSGAEELCGQVVSEHWSTPQNLITTIESMGVLAILQGAKAAGQLERLEAELFAVSRLLVDQRDLRIQLSELSDATATQRATFFQNLLGDSIMPLTSALVYRAVKLSSHGRLLQTLRGYRQESARVNGTRLVTVTAAVPLTASQRERLQKVVERQIGQAVTLTVAIDPSLIGGFHINYGDEAADSSVLSELAQAQRAIAR